VREKNRQLPSKIDILLITIKILSDYPTMITFDELESACLQSDLDIGAAEAHGILTGLLCTNSATDQQTWLTLVEDRHPPGHINNALWTQLYQSTLAQLAGEGFDFQPLLPGDDSSLELRTESLAEWCRGFLYGVSHSKLQQQMGLSENVTEIIEDLTQISRASYDGEEGNEEGEAAYMELSEYIRAGAMLIYAELQAPMTSTMDQTKLH
jgi:uncharacterized protein